MEGFNVFGVYWLLIYCCGAHEKRKDLLKSVIGFNGEDKLARNVMYKLGNLARFKARIGNGLALSSTLFST